MNDIDREFLAYHEANPHVFDKIVSYTFHLRLAGRKRYGIAAIIERVRWDYATSTSEDDKGFKINNDFRSRYARLIEQKYPELKGFFKTRAIDITSMFAKEEQFELL
jgi:hypothetical protein